MDERACGDRPARMRPASDAVSASIADASIAYMPLQAVLRGHRRRFIPNPSKLSYSRLQAVRRPFLLGAGFCGFGDDRRSADGIRHAGLTLGDSRAMMEPYEGTALWCPPATSGTGTGG